MINYAIDPEVLLPYLPSKTKLDMWNGVCYITLAGFLFTDVKALGIKIPEPYQAFPEINL